MKVCKDCKRLLPCSAYYRHPKMPDGLFSRCKECHQKAAKVSRQKSGLCHRHRMYSNSYCSAKHRGLVHSLRISDIPLPTKCRYLDIQLNYEDKRDRGHDSPSLDRLDSTRGYTIGNIQVISDLANRMKSEASIDQMLAFAIGVIKAHSTATTIRLLSAWLETQDVPAAKDSN